MFVWNSAWLSKLAKLQLIGHTCLSASNNVWVSCCFWEISWICADRCSFKQNFEVTTHTSHAQGVSYERCLTLSSKKWRVRPPAYRCCQPFHYYYDICEEEQIYLLLQLPGLFHLSCFLCFPAHPRPRLLRRWNLLLSSITHSAKDDTRTRSWQLF